MSFKAAVAATAGLEAAYQSGLQALSIADRARITARNPRRLAGSANVDEALRDRFPHLPRWDYAVGSKLNPKQNDKVFWIEVHPATEGEVNTLLAKLAWLKQWLIDVQSPLDALEREFIWIASGKTSFTAQSPQAKRLALQGIRCVGGHFQIG